MANDTSFNAPRKILDIGNATTVSEYCHYFESSFLCFMINRYSHSLKRQQGYTKKRYFIDTALARAVGFLHSEDRGRLLENIVFLELRRLYKNIYFHKEKQECDFFIKENHTITSAFQVTFSLDNEKTRKREVAGIIEAMDYYSLSEGYILIEEGEERDEVVDSNGEKRTIHIIPIWKWLFSKEK